MSDGVFNGLYRKVGNFFKLNSPDVICYVSADPTNIGDRVSALGVQHMFGVAGIETFASRAGLSATKKLFKRLVLSRKNVLIVVGGGGLLQKCFEPFWEILLETGLDFVLFGVGANELLPERTLPSEDVIDALGVNALGLHVRDAWTAELFTSSSNLRIGVCPSVNYLYRKYGWFGCSVPKDLLLHVCHPTDIRMAGGNLNDIRSKVKKIAEARNLIYGEVNHIDEKLSTLISQYKKSKLIVSSRLHGCIFSYALGLPFIPISTDRKTEAFIATHMPKKRYFNCDFDSQDLHNEVEKLLLENKSYFNCDFINKLNFNYLYINELLSVLSNRNYFY